MGMMRRAWQIIRNLMKKKFNKENYCFKDIKNSKDHTFSVGISWSLSEAEASIRYVSQQVTVTALMSQPCATDVSAEFPTLSFLF